MKFFVRPFENEDAEAAAHVFFESVRLGTAEYYDESQRRVWAEKVPDTARWRERLCSQKTFVAESDRKIIGFMTIAADGYIDLAFIAPEAIGVGVAKALYDEVELTASQSGTSRLYSEASYPARKFFERQGWSVVKEQTVSKGQVILTNFAMEKYLR